MFKSTESQDHGVPQHLIDSFLNFLKIYQNFSLPPEVQEKAFFIIAANDKDGVYGGAVLYPHPLATTLNLTANEPEEESLNKMFSAFQFKGKEYWRARVGLYIGEISCRASLSKALDLCDYFYQDIYDAFKEFGSRNSIDYLPFTIHMADVLLSLPHKKWPYFLEVRVDGHSPHYFHGVLSLNGRRFKIRTQKRAVKQLNAFSKVIDTLEEHNKIKDQREDHNEHVELLLLASTQYQNPVQLERPVQ